VIIFFKFVLNNARSLHAHIKDIQSDPNILNADVIGLAETRLTNDDRSECYNIQGYNFIRKDQAQTHYGTRPPHGVALYVRNTVAVLEIKEFSCSNLEFIAADTIGTKGHMQVVIMYKSPQCTLQ
jgi:exonuclease III